MLHRRELWVDLARPLIRHLAHAAIPKAIQFLVLALAALLCFLAAGCTSAHHERVAYFAEYGEDGRTNYYRVKVSWTAENGIVDYRSGWFDARAVDELFGEVSGKHDLEAARKNRAQVAVARTFDAYMTALEQGDSVDAIAVRRAAYEEALERALTVVQVVPITEAGQVLNPLDDKKSKKFLIIFFPRPGCDHSGYSCADQVEHRERHAWRHSRTTDSRENRANAHAPSLAEERCERS